MPRQSKESSYRDEYRLLVPLGTFATTALSATDLFCIETVCNLESGCKTRNGTFYTNMIELSPVPRVTQ